MTKNALLLSCLVALSTSAIAVEGYKDLAFGSSEADLMAKKFCTMQKVETGMAEYTQYGCNDFKFGGRVTTAYAYFINGEFLRLAVDIDWSEMTTVSDLIFKKYGPLSSKSTEEEMVALDSQPNATAYLAFDQDTVYLLMQTDESMNKAGVVLYSDPSFERKALEVQQAAMENSL